MLIQKTVCLLCHSDAEVAYGVRPFRLSISTGRIFRSTSPKRRWRSDSMPRFIPEEGPVVLRRYRLYWDHRFRLDDRRCARRRATPDSYRISITLKVPAHVIVDGKQITNRMHVGDTTIHTTQIYVIHASGDTRCLAVLVELSMKIRKLKQEEGKGHFRGKDNICRLAAI